uniref:DUF4062 domain-containing protein n=1 Tax=Heterorhabditis bacteriophora TaxID=37862 RepID=A0A1I7WRS8_HETBA
MFRLSTTAGPKIGEMPETDEKNLIQPANTKIFLVYNDAEELALERQVMWMDVLPELQNYAFHSGFDLEWIDPLIESGKLTNQVAEREDNNWLVCILGDKYGTPEPPTTIRKEEFEAIRTAIFEQNAGMSTTCNIFKFFKTIIKLYYCTEMPLNFTLMKIIECIKKCNLRLRLNYEAFEEGTINQVNTHQQNRFSWSPIHYVVNHALQLRERCTFLLRRFEGEVIIVYAIFERRFDSFFLIIKLHYTNKIANLKNEVSGTLEQKMVFPYIHKLDNGDIASFLTSKEADKYRDLISRQNITSLLLILLLMKIYRMKVLYLIRFIYRPSSWWRFLIFFWICYRNWRNHFIYFWMIFICLNTGHS